MVIIGSGSIIIQNNKVLLLKRINSSTFDGLWTNPGGKVEPGESLEEAAIRETLEETGIQINILSQLSSYEDYYNSTLIGIYTGFQSRIVSGTPKLLEPKKFSNIKYFTRERLPDKLAPYTKLYLKDIGFVE